MKQKRTEKFLEEKKKVPEKKFLDTEWLITTHL